MLAEQTDEFLQSQLLEVERQLKEREKQLEDVPSRRIPARCRRRWNRTSRRCRTPSCSSRRVQESITRDRDRQVSVQRQLADLAMAASRPRRRRCAARQAQAPQTYARQLEQARERDLKNLRLKLTSRIIRTSRR